MVTLAHELGHAAAGLKFTKNPVLVRVGRADAAVKLRIGRLLIVFSPFGAGGFCRTRGRVTRQQALMRVLAGPAVNLLLAPLLWLAGQGASDAARPVLFTLAALNGLALLNLIWARRFAVAPARRLEVAPLRVGLCVSLIFSDWGVWRRLV